MRYVTLAIVMVFVMVSAPLALAGEKAADQQKAAEAGPQPKIEFVKEHHDFGRVDQGKTVKHQFILKNTGEGLLKITNVRASCGCTVVKHSTQVVSGATGYVEAAFNTAGRSGKNRKTVTVTSNDPKKPNITLSFEADIFEALRVTPNHVHFGVVAQGDMPSREIQLIAAKGEKLDIKQVTGKDDWFEASFKAIEPEEGKADDVARGKVTVKLTKPLDAGRYNSEVVLKTGHKGKETVKIPVVLNIVPEMKIAPEKLELGTVEAGQPTTAEIVISDRDPNVYVGAPVINVHGAASQRTVRYDKDRALIALTFNPDEGAEEITGTIEIKTNHPRHQTITVPVHGTIGQ